MRRILAAALAVAALLPVAPAAAQQGGSCAAPRVDAFVLPPTPLRIDEAVTIRLHVHAAGSVTVDWPDGTRSTATVSGDVVSLPHTFARLGPQRIVASARSACAPDGPPATGAITVNVRRPCATARDRSVLADDCYNARGLVEVAQAGLTTRATWRFPPCNDVAPTPIVVQPEPTARAACVAPTGPPAVRGRLPVRDRSAVLIRLGAPAGRVRVALGDARRPRTRFARARAVGGSPRLFRIRIARITTSTRLWLTVSRAGTRDHFVAGVRATPGS